MDFIPIPEVAEVTWVFSSQGSRMNNVWHCKSAVLWDETTLLDVATEMAANWYNSISANVANTVQLVQVEAVALYAEDAPGIIYVPATNNFGQMANPILPGNVTLALTKRTLLRGRSFRGRVYHVGLCEQMVTGDVVGSAYVASLIVGYNQIRTAQDTNSHPLVVASRYHNNAPRVTGVATNIIGFDSDGVIDSQRRRLSGRGA